MSKFHRLALLDQLMFKLEEGGLSPIHMCGAVILETSDSPYPVDGKIIADHLAACLEEVPLMRQRLIQDPLKLGDLRLVDDPGFAVRHHITCTTLPSPGGYGELAEALGNFSSSRMDLSRPLWSMEVIDGLENGRIAIALCLHHAILDGTGALRILGALWSEDPTPGRKPKTEAWKAPALPSRLRLLSDATLENAQRLYVKLPRFLLSNTAPLIRTLATELSKRIPFAEQHRESASPLPKVRKTSLNVAPISSKRAVSYLELPLDDIKALRKAFDCSINDLALLFSSCALQHYFAGIGERVDFDLVAGMPINLRSEDDDSAGNALALSRVSLHNTVADIRDRLRAIVHDTTSVKRSTKPAESLENTSTAVDYKALGTLFSPLVLDAMIHGVVRFGLLDRATLINVAVANVPGPQVPVYVAGARMHSQVPMGPCADTLALNITIGSTDECLILGFHGCARAIRDKELLPAGALQAFETLKKSAGLRRKPAARTAGSKHRRKSAPKPGTGTRTGSRRKSKTVAKSGTGTQARRSGKSESGGPAH